ncbi:MAG: winged helix DNA-binding protein [Lentilitoribacter sp.]
MAACGHPELNGLEILVVHHINHRESSKRLSDICFLLNIDDTHTVNYAIKKLLKADLVKGQKQGKEMFYSTTEKGQNVCERYREIREQCLLESITRVDGMDEELGEVANTLRTLSGMYDQASRAASSL